MPDIAHQYRTIVSGAGFRNRADRGRLRFNGADRVSFLQALVTNDLIALKSGQGAYAAYLTPQGRMLTDLHLFLRPDSILADVPAALAATLAARFDALVFAEDVQVTDVSVDLGQIAVVGGRASAMVAAATGADATALDQLPVWSQLDIEGGFVARTDDAEIGSYDVVVDASRQQGLVNALESAGVVAMSTDVAEAIRVQQGRPAFGVDMNTDTIPLEAGLLERAISTSKGCYVGQEIIIRVLHRGGGRVAKRLVRLALENGDEVGFSVVPGWVLAADGKDVGAITSIASHPDGEGSLALAYVHRDHAEAGRTLAFPAHPGIFATIIGLAG
jgi:folate-binding protein YgfZ